MRRVFVLCLLVSSFLLPAAAFAGGAWVPAPREGDVQLGWSRKRAISSWDSRGNLFENRSATTGLISYHDFRYTYLSGEVGLWPRLSTRFLVTHLDGFEGPQHDLERNTGLSDAWFGFKYAIRQDEWPMAIAATLRTSYFYDLPGAYNRHLFDSNGEFRGVSPEWRGLLKEDYTLSWLVSRSFAEGRGWANLEIGYSFREGAPADEVPVTIDVGYPLPWRNLKVKGSLVYVQSMGNDTPRQADDRFGSRPGFNFNNASMARSGIGLYLPFGKREQWGFEAGFNRWFWGRSVRQYEEPFFSMGYRF